MKLRVPHTAKRFAAPSRAVRRALVAFVPPVVLVFANPAQAVTDYYVTWNATDATVNIEAKIQQAENAGGASRIILEYHSTPWFVNKPIVLDVPNMEFWIKGGTVMPKAGNLQGFQLGGASLFKIYANNVKMNGYRNGVNLSAGRATLEMRKDDYADPFYDPPGSRHCIAVKGANNPVVHGFILTRSGGDGICVDVESPQITSNHPYNVVVKDVVSRDNYRNGMSVISVDKLTVTNCHFEDTASTGGGDPKVGLDIEPSRATDLLKAIEFIDCSFKNNEGDNVRVDLRELVGAGLTPVNITFDYCLIDGINGGPSNGMSFYSLNPDTGPTGTILVKNHTIQNMRKSGLRFTAWGVDRVSTTMSTVWVINCGRDDSGAQIAWKAPILFGTELETDRVHGEVKFINSCRIQENFFRPDDEENTMVWANRNVQEEGMKDVTGSILVVRPDTSDGDLLYFGDDPAPINCTVSVTEPQP